MAGENNPTDQPTDPQVVEVDNIEIGNDDSIVDDEGRIVQSFDPEKNIIYKLKGKETAFTPPIKEEGKDSGSVEEGEDEGEEEEEEGTDEGNEDEDDNEDDVEYSNPAEYVLRQAGYKGDTIKIGDDTVKISELTPEQQVEILASEYDSQLEAREREIAELKGRQPELKFDDPQAQELVNYLKEGGDIKKLAKEILSRDPAAQAKMLSDDDVLKLSIKKQFPDFTDEEVAEELKEMTDGQKQRRAKAVRAQMEKEKPSFADMTEEQKNANAKAILAEQEKFNQDVTKIKTLAKDIKEIAGVKLTDKHMEYLINQIVPSKYDDDSAFVKDLIDNPKALIEAQFYKTYGSKLIANMAKNYNELKKQFDELNKGKEKLSDEPIRTYGGSKPGKKGTGKGQSKNVNEPGFDTDKWLNDSNVL